MYRNEPADRATGPDEIGRGEPGAGGTRRGPRDWLPLFAILAAALVRHAASLRAPFFADDYLFLEQARGRSLLAALVSPDPIGNFMRPVGRQLHFWLTSHLGGGSAAVFHAANLAFFLAALALLFAIARRLAGARAATLATAFLALHYAADVPLLWCAGSQDLLALVGGLGAIALHLGGRRLLAAAAFALAVLAKESVAVLPLVAVLADRRAGEPLRAPLRRAIPLLAIGVVWAAVWVATARLRPVAANVIQLDWNALPAALLHLVQVGIGLEIPAAGWTFSLSATGLASVALAVLAVAWAFAGRSRAGAIDPERATGGPGWVDPEGRSAPETDAPGEMDADTRPESAAGASRAIAVGAAWALAAVLPIAAVTSIWSAYFYLFALCGVAIVLGGWLANRPAWLGMLGLAALLLGSETTRGMREFATAAGPWTAQSHVNRHYLERGMSLVSRHLAELKRQRPTLPPRSTVFFANVAPSSGWQIGDGALLRHAYRDSTLRSYYLTSFSLEKTRRGPFFFFAVMNDTLLDRSSHPELLRSFAYSMVLGGQPEAAAEALRLQMERMPEDRESPYWLAWLLWTRGERAAAERLLERAGIAARPGPAPELDTARTAIAAGDTAAAIRALLAGRSRHGLDIEVHSRLAALWLAIPEHRPHGVFEALAVTALDPERADGWRKLAAGQLAEGQYGPAAESLERYFSLGGVRARDDSEALAVRSSLQRMLPGGDLAQAALHE